MVEFAKQNWLAQHHLQSKGRLKRTLYFFLRSLLSRRYSRHLAPETIKKHRPRWVLGSRGMPLETRRRWGARYLANIREATLLVQGTGTGWDVVSWARLRPRRIIATDLFPFEESWQEIARYCLDRYRVPVEFRTAPLEDHGFLDSDSVDLIVSDAVYEHCRDLPRVMRESRRLLRPGGYLYASYGPLYFCAGGDHFSGRGGLEHAYNHLRLDQSSYQRYLEAHREEVEDFQDGMRYLELDLFSRLTTGEYLQIYREAGFIINQLILELCHQALDFKMRFPREFQEMVAQSAGRLSPDDLLIKVHLLRLQKPEGLIAMRKRLIQGIGANFLGQIINLASRVLLVPLFLTAWGAEVYGEWLLLTSIVAYLSLTDLGGQIYIVNRLTQAYAQNDIPLFRKILHTGLGLFLIIPLAAFAGFVGLIFLFPPGSLLQIGVTHPTVVFLVLAILAFQFVFSLPQGILIGVYRAVGLLPRGVMLANVMQLASFTLVGLGLWLQGGLVAIACLQLLPFLAVALAAGRDLNRRFPQFRLLSLGEADFSFGLSFIKPSLHFFGIQLSQAFSIQGTVLVVGMVLGSVQVVVFSTMRTIINLSRSFFEQISHAAWPELTRLDAQHDEEKFFRLFRTIFRSTLVAAVIFMATFHFWGETLYHFWLRKTVTYQQPVMDLFLIYMGQLLIWLTCSHPLMATNRHRALSKMLLVSSLLSIGLAYLGGRRLGLPGVILGMITADLLLPCWFVPYLLSRYQPRFSGWFFVKEIGPVILSLAVLISLPWSAPVVIAGLIWWWTGCLAGLGLSREGWMPFGGRRP